MKLCITACLLAATAHAQTRPLVLKAAHHFDGHQITSPGLIVVDRNKIFAVGPSATIPANAEILDFGDATLSPGFIDAHTHLSMDDSGNFQRMLVDGLQKTIPELTLMALENLRKTLHAGLQQFATSARVTSSTSACETLCEPGKSKARACWFRCTR